MVIDLPAVTPRPRSVPVRLVYTAVIVAAVLAGPGLIGAAARRMGADVSAQWPSPTLVLLVLTALIARKVSYRWFDALVVLIPVVGLVYLCKFAWRLSLLPYRNWSPRPEEAAHWRKVAHPSAPGAGLYLATPE